MSDMEKLVARLESVATRLEKCASGRGAPAGGADDDDDYGKKYIFIGKDSKRLSQEFRN